MIAEALLHTATFPFTTKAHRKFIRYSVSLWSRAGRCRKAWEEHEKRSKRAMLAAMDGLKQRRTAVVLGSGLLRDIPIEELAARFDTVILVDLVHLASIRFWLKAKGLRNVRLIERDLSGYDMLAAGAVSEPLAFLRRIPYLDFVVSANVLSQIGYSVKRRLAATKTGNIGDDAAAQMIAAHLQGLADLPCRACLVTDISYAVIDRNGKVHEDVDLLEGRRPPPYSDEWPWPVAPFGEESRDYQIAHRVIATRLGK